MTDITHLNNKIIETDYARRNGLWFIASQSAMKVRANPKYFLTCGVGLAAMRQFVVQFSTV